MVVDLGSSGNICTNCCFRHYWFRWKWRQIGQYGH